MHVKRKNELWMKIIGSIFGLVFVISTTYSIAKMYTYLPLEALAKQAEDLEEKAREAFKQGNPQKTIQLLEEAKKLDPQNFIRSIHAGNIYRDMQNWLKAQESYEEAIRLKPGVSTSYELLALVYAEQRQFSKAEENFKLALKFDPKNISSLHNSGVLYLQQKKFREAEKQFLEVLKIDAKYMDAYRNLGMLYRLEGNHLRTMNAFRRYLELNTSASKPEVEEIRGFIREAKENFEKEQSKFKYQKPNS